MEDEEVSNRIKNKILAVSDLIRLNKQYGTVLLLCPTLWSLFIASDGSPSPGLVLLFTVGAFLMRSAGCAVNDIMDMNFDRSVERTKNRPLADGRLSVKEAAAVFVILILASLGLAVLYLNELARVLFIFAPLIAVIYPQAKRYVQFPQAVLGIAFGFGALIAWADVRGSLSIVPVLIFTANIFLVIAYDTIYALMDIDDDRKIGVRSTAILFGNNVYSAVVLMYSLFIAFMIAAGVFAG
ncbi:MAG: 4-hydroxybenzoate octaprenyltransferase, partial [Solirubrobacteraceae bacterium]|nr:4-hydroxybenzoate octaprenyltransferase [Solirubrobacteraceae bacterium]